MISSNVKLRERVKELKCLYALSRIAWESNNDIQTILTKTIKILPASMQFPRHAQSQIVLNGETYSSAKFDLTGKTISSNITADGQKYGVVRIGYLDDRSSRQFMNEEKKMLDAVARELSFIWQRHVAAEEKQKLKSQLQHVERMAFVGELTAGIAHELNEPLGRILGFAQLIKKSGSLSSQQEEDIERILKASLYTREIIKKLMIFSRQMPQQITRVDLNETVSNILYFMDSKYYSGAVKIHRKLDSNLPLVEADAVQMSQVLVNLLTNAIHAMPNGGEMFVVTGTKKGFVSLSVKDTGIGMSPTVKEKIFEPFYTTKPVGQGTGLGLSVVQGIISAHDGKINVSTSPGNGSRFEVLIPIGRVRKSKKV